MRKLVFCSVLIWLFVYASAFNCLLSQSHLICHKPYLNLKEFLLLFIVFSKQSHPLSLELLGNAYLCKKLHSFFVCLKFGKILTFSWFCCKIRSKQLNIFSLFSDKRQRWPPLSQAGWCLFFSLQAALPWFSTSGRPERCYVFFVCVMSLFFFTVKEERRFSFIFGFIRPWNMNFQQQSADFLFGMVLSFCLFLLKTSSPGEQVPFRRHRTSKCRFADCRGC